MKKKPMVRKQLYIEPAQNELVKELAAKYGKSEGHIIRTAIDGFSKGQFRAGDVDLSCWEEELQFIRSRARLKAAQVSGGKRWTRDEIYER